MNIRNEIFQVAKVLAVFTGVVILPPLFGLFVFALHGHLAVFA